MEEVQPMKAMAVPLLLALAVAPLAGAEVAKSEEPQFKRITVDEVSARMKKGEKLFVFDNNRPELYEKGHLPGAVWLSSREMKETDLPADKGATLVFYCHNER